MLVVGLLAAGAVIMMVCLLAFRAWMRGRRLEGQACITEEQARENAAPLTTAILPASADHDREGSPLARDRTADNASLTG